MHSTFGEAQLKKLDGALDLLESVSAQFDGFYVTQARLGAGLLRNAVQAMRERASASAVSDFDFALADLKQMTTELPAQQAEELEAILLLIDDVMRAAREQTQLGEETLTLIRSLRLKLAERSAAIDRQQYRTPGTPAEEPPHDAESLRPEATRLQTTLREAGFSTPELDSLVSGSGTFYLHDVRQLIEELDVISS